MTTEYSIKPAPVRKSVRVTAPPEQAFAVFVAMGRWWPPSHSINRGVPFSDAVIEPRAGGRWYERGTDGSTCEWGRVVAYDPPNRLLLLWQIDATWAYSPDFETEVEILFEADGSGTTVTLEHRNIERFGAAAEAVRGSLDGEQGWSGILALFAANAA